MSTSSTERLERRAWRLPPTVVLAALLAVGCTTEPRTWEEEWLAARGAGDGEVPELPFDLGDVEATRPEAITIHSERHPDDLSEGEAFEVYAAWLLAHESMYADPEPERVSQVFAADWRFYDDVLERMSAWNEAGEHRDVPEVAIEHFELANTGEGAQMGRPYVGVEVHYTYAEGTTRVDADGEVVSQDFPVGLTQRTHTVLVRENGAWRVALVVAAQRR